MVYDAAHHGTGVLKRRFEADARWADLITRLSQTKARLQQTPDAYLLSPSLRAKARYMNLAALLRWCRAILVLLDRGPSGGVASVHAKVRYGWLKRFRRAIGQWSRWKSTARCRVAFVRTHGLSRCCDVELAADFRRRPAQQRHKQWEAELLQFVQTQSAGTQPGERLAGSTEVLESVFGKRKTLERQESNSGITTLLLSLGAMLGT